MGWVVLKIRLARTLMTPHCILEAAVVAPAEAGSSGLRITLPVFSGRAGRAIAY
jgi:hypothetical protein